MPFVPDAAPTTGRFVPDQPSAQDKPVDLSTPEGRMAADLPPTAMEDAARGLLAGQPLHGVRGSNIARKIILQGGGSVIGSAAGVAAAPFTGGASIPVLAGAGGGLGNLAAQKIDAYLGLQPDKINKGELAASTILSAIPGASAESAGISGLVREGLKQGIAGAGAKTLETEVDQGRLPTAKEYALSTILPAIGGGVAQRLQAANPEIQAAVAASKTLPVKAQTLKDAGEIGLIVPPTHGGGGALSGQLEGIGGKAAVNQAVALKNQSAINAGVVEDLGLPKGTEVTMATLKGIRKEEAAPYAEVDKLVTDAKDKIAEIKKRFNSGDPHELAIQKSDPKTLAELQPLATQADADLTALREARFARDRHFDNYRSSSNPDELSKAIEARNQANALEVKLEQSVEAAGKPDLAAKLRAARTRIAKSYSAEEALNLGDANFDAARLGAQFDRGVPLTGNMLTVAKFQQAFPSSAREAAKVPTPGVSKLSLPLALLGGGGAYEVTHNPALAAITAGTSMVAPGLARRLILSRPYQNAFAQIPGPPLRVAPDKYATALRLFSQAAGQADGQ